MNPRDKLLYLVEDAKKLSANPLEGKKSIKEIMYLGELRADIFMANESLNTNNMEMIHHYINKLKLYFGDSNGTEENKDNG